jgi:hypothetical protein
MGQREELSKGRQGGGCSAANESGGKGEGPARHRTDDGGRTASVNGAVGGVLSHSQVWSAEREEARELG